MVMEKAKLTRYLDKIRLGNKITQTQITIEITLDIFENRPVTEKKQIKRLGKRKQRKKKEK